MGDGQAVMQLSAVLQVGAVTGRRWRPWVCSMWKESAEDSNKTPIIPKQASQDHYAVLGITSHATLADIKLAFRQLARKYHPDVNNETGAAEVFKTIHVAYEILSDKASRHDYDYSVRVQACAARKKVHKNHHCSSMYSRRTHSHYKKGKASYWKTIASDDLWESNATGSAEQGGSAESYRTTGKRQANRFEFEEDPDTWAKLKLPSLCRGCKDSILDVVVVFCLVGFIWHVLGVQLALTYFVFFIPHNKEHTVWYRLASLMAWLIGGPKGLALHYGIVTMGWLYGKGYDMVLAFFISAIWIEAHFSPAFTVPRGAILLMTYICLGGMVHS